LDLCGGGIDAKGLRSLAKLENLASLRELGLQFNELDDKAAKVLIEHAFFQPLSLIRCAGNPLTEEARQRLRDHFGPRVSFEARWDEDHLFNIQNERFVTGFGRDHVQMLLYGTDDETRLVLFDHEGNLLSTQTRPTSRIERPAEPWQDLPLETR